MPVHVYNHVFTGDRKVTTCSAEFFTWIADLMAGFIDLNECQGEILFLSYHYHPKKFGHPKNCCNYPKNWTMYHRVMSPKDADGMENNVDPDQTAQESLIWVYTVCPDLTVWKFRIIMVCCVITAYYAGSFQPIMLCHYSLLCSQSMEAPAAERPKQISAKPNNFGTKMFLSNKAHAFGATC